MMAKDLRTAFLAIAAVSAKLGTRIEPGKLPQNATLPAVEYEVSTDPRRVYKGKSTLQHARVTYDVHALDFLTARETAEALEDGADQIKGTTGSTDFDAVNVTSILDLPEPDTVPGLPTSRVRVDLSVWYREV